MYAKNNLASLGKLHSNALMKSQSPVGFKMKPLSEIQNSLQKMKARKKKSSKSKSRSKQNTPQNQGSSQRRSSIGTAKTNIYFHKQQQKPITTPTLRTQRKPISYLNEHVNSIVQSYDSFSSKTPSQLSINSKNLAESMASSCASSEYQLPMSQCSQKSVKFSDKHLQVNMLRANQKKSGNKDDDRLRTPSILKNKLSLNSVNSQRSSSMRSSTKASRSKDFYDLGNISANKLLKSKYEALIKKFEESNRRYGKNLLKSYSKLQKFTDDLFPPQNSSIFSYSIHNKSQKPKNIVWKRIPQLYPLQNLILLRQQPTKSLIKITKKDLKNDPSLCQDYFVLALNCIRENRKLLEKMFESQQISLNGVYLVNIYQDNSWKYVIVDDYIPTVYDQAKEVFVPAFVNVEKAEGNTSDVVEIWPYLLEKAYAAYYSKYQALKYGNEQDFVAELTGVPYKFVKREKIDVENKQHLELQALLRQQRGVIMGQRIVNDLSTFFCILPDLNSITKKSQGFCTALSKQKQYKPTRQKLQNFLQTLHGIYIYELSPPANLHLSYLCPQTKKSTQGSFRSKRQQATNASKQQTPDISLRCFTIPQPTKSILSIKQKDCRFYFQGKVQYKYIWLRAILLLKQHNEDYRWIDGRYSNSKTLTFFLNLEPGEYYLLLMPQWHPSYKYDMTLSMFTECPTVTLEKRPYITQIFQKGCADIAQRQGSMNQINKYICAYNYVSEQTGLVVENINNQRENGPVTVMRSINGLKCQVSLVPVNKEFYFSTNADYDCENVKRLKKTIEVDIQASQHFTVVLKTVGGIDKKFFESFDFGS